MLEGKHLEGQIQSSFAVLMNVSNGAILFEKKMHDKIHPASTTKIATALFVLSLTNDLEQMVVATKQSLRSVSRKYKDENLDRLPPYILQTDGTSFKIMEGEQLSLRSLLYGLLLSSGNDAANVIAAHFGEGDIGVFMEKMNLFLSSIGCKNSFFCNPHGLHHKDQISTAYDMAIIAKEAIKNPIIAQIVRSKEFLRPKTNKQQERIITQANRLVIPGKLQFDEAIGMKTGYTQNAGYCLLAAATDGKRDLVAALFNAKEDSIRYRDAISLFSLAFEEEKTSRLLFEKGRRFQNNGSLNEDIKIDIYPSEEEFMRIEAKIGSIDIYINDTVIGTFPLQVASSPSNKTKNHYYWLLMLPLIWLIRKGFRSVLG
jgi:D-alanyl-D-alanine carboxypeptidase (penicillin-binding protein 5/6)